jgi:hypothetical protein
MLFSRIFADVVFDADHYRACFACVEHLLASRS